MRDLFSEGPRTVCGRLQREEVFTLGLCTLLCCRNLRQALRVLLIPEALVKGLKLGLKLCPSFRSLCRGLDRLLNLAAFRVVRAPCEVSLRLQELLLRKVALRISEA